MNTNTAAAVVTGARHLRTQRNGQDAVLTIVTDAVAVAVVCDGCSSGSSSEVGARLGVRLFARELVALLESGAPVQDERTWSHVRERVVAAFRSLAVSGREADVSGREADVSGREADVSAIDIAMVRECFLFTIVAAAMTRDGAAVWVLGDGGYAIDGITTRVGPFENNEPPYLAYDLLADVGWFAATPAGSFADPSARAAHFAVVPAARTIVVATDGALELVDAASSLEGNLACFASPRLLANPDTLRRDLIQFTRSEERIDWREQRVIRTPALLQDDCAVAVLQRSPREADRATRDEELA